MVRIPSLTGRHAVDRETEDRAEPVVEDKVEAKPVITERFDRPEVAPPILRPRASALATLGLILGVVAAGSVATGVLALPGVVVGVLGLLLAIVGTAATARSHVTGRFAALFGLLLSLAAVVVGVLALTDAITWPNTDVNEVGKLADWIRAELPWTDRFDG